MVLADGGVVCIDEFDKMRESDRVAIHEVGAARGGAPLRVAPAVPHAAAPIPLQAMEQQTISIAKAGITTVLNSRCAVLAAANPIFGRYDDSKAAAENIDFLPSILSRFDLIFIVRDVRDEDRDKAIARHVMEVHIQASEGTSVEVGEEGEIDLETMRKYISYCRSRCAPRLTRAAASKLGNEYVQIRQSSKRGGERSVVPITVRQLEAIVRVSEALAKMELAVDVSPHHVEEALRLFKTSTMAAVHHGEDGACPPSTGAPPACAPCLTLARRTTGPWEGAFGVYGAEEVQRAEGWLNAHIPVHDRASVRALRKMFSSVSVRRWPNVERGRGNTGARPGNLERRRTLARPANHLLARSGHGCRSIGPRAAAARPPRRLRVQAAPPACGAGALGARGRTGRNAALRCAVFRRSAA